MNAKLTVLIPLLFLCVAGNAQFQKGTRMAGATVASLFFNSGNSDISVTSIGSTKSKITSYGVSINPSLGWFVSDRTVVGATLNINPGGQKTTYEENGSTYQSDKTNTFNFGIGGFARNYFSVNKPLLPFAQASLNGGISSLKTEGFFYGGAGSSAYKDSYSGNSSGGSFFNASFTGGFTKMIGTNAGLDFYIGYNFSYNKHTFKRTTQRDEGIDGTIEIRTENETTTKFTNHGFLLGVGFQVFIHPKK
jgi:hypothetical protein